MEGVGRTRCLARAWSAPASKANRNDHKSPAVCICVCKYVGFHVSLHHSDRSNGRSASTLLSSTFLSTDQSNRSCKPSRIERGKRRANHVHRTEDVAAIALACFHSMRLGRILSASLGNQSSASPSCLRLLPCRKKAGNPGGTKPRERL